MAEITILHTADLHIGRVLHGKNLLEDQSHILSAILDIARARRPDAIVIAGDLFDRSVPSAEAVRLADWFFQEAAGTLKIPTIVIAGNHDSPERLEFAAGLLGRQGLHIRGSFDAKLDPVVIGGPEGEVEIYPIPYAEPVRIHAGLNAARNEEHEGDPASHQEAWDRIMEVLSERWGRRPQCLRILVAHLFAAGGQASDSERPLSMGGAEVVAANSFQPFDLVLLGHLHRPQTVFPGVHYSGSPLCYGLGEIDQGKRVGLLHIDPHAELPPTLESLPLLPLRPVRLLRGTLLELLGQQSDDFIFARLTDPLPVHEAFFRLQERFPQLLHVERDIAGQADGDIRQGERRRDALASGELAVISAFLQDMGNAEIPADWLQIITEVLQEQNSQEREATT